MADYLAVLPKELRELLNYYVNYDNWYYLNSILEGQYYLCCIDDFIDIEERKRQRKDDLFKLLHASIVTKPYFVEKVLSSADIKLTIQISPAELVTKDKLLINFRHILFTMPRDTLILLANMNDILRRLNYKERIYAHTFNHGNCTFDIAKID